MKSGKDSIKTKNKRSRVLVSHLFDDMWRSTHPASLQQNNISPSESPAISSPSPSPSSPNFQIDHSNCIIVVVDAENSDNDLHPVEVHDLELDLSTHSPVKKKHEMHQQQHNTKGNTGDKRDK